jgi:tRNA1(Val) A37 N6-methylase TrmN6
MRKVDYLPGHKEISLVQDTDMFCVNSDTEALASFIDIKHKDNVIDFGTNQGALLLYASLFEPASLTGLDINEKALELAKLNLDNNHIKNYELINDNIVTFTHDPYDVIICNPPYFETKENNMSNNNYKNLAKHETILNLQSLIKSIERNLKYNGRLYFLFLTSRLEEVVSTLNRYHLTIKEMKFVYDKDKENSNVFMVKCVKNARLGLNSKKPLVFSREKNKL